MTVSVHLFSRDRGIVSQMGMPVQEILWAVFVQQFDERLKAHMRRVVQIADPPGRGVGDDDIHTAAFAYV